VNVTEYNKTEAVMEFPRVIARFFPEEVGQLLVSYIVDVLPFRLLISARIGADPSDTLCPYLWETNGQAWDTQRFTQIMSRESEEGLGMRLTMEAWRQIAIAIDKDVIQHSSGMAAQIAANHTLQAGHTEDTESHHYALQVNMLHGTTHESLVEFNSVSTSWHQIWPFSRSAPADSYPNKHVSLPYQRQPQTSLASSHAPFVELLHGLHWQIASVERALHSLTVVNNTLLCSPRRTNMDDAQHTATVSTTALKLLYGDDAAFRTKFQERAVTVVASSSDDVIVQLPTASGKSLVISIPAYIDRHSTTLVVVPFNTLRANLIQHCTNAGVASRWYTAGETGQYPILFAVPENFTCTSFHTYIHHLIAYKNLRRIIFDECHTIVMHNPWREAIGAMASFVNKIQVQKVWMSATLSPYILNQLQDIMKIDLDRCRRIRSSTNRPNIRHTVVRVLNEERINHIHTLVTAASASSPAKNVLILVMQIDLGRQISTALNVPFCSSKTSKSNQEQMIAGFIQGSTPVLVGTSMVGLGLDIPRVDQVIHVGPGYGLAAYFQAACRGGRRNTPSESIVLVTDAELQSLSKNTNADCPVLYRFLTTSECRRTFLSMNFDSEVYSCTASDEACDNCSQSIVPATPMPLQRQALPANPGLSWVFNNTISQAPKHYPSVESANSQSHAQLIPSSITHISDSQSTFAVLSSPINPVSTSRVSLTVPSTPVISRKRARVDNSVQNVGFRTASSHLAESGDVMSIDSSSPVDLSPIGDMLFPSTMAGFSVASVAALRAKLEESNSRTAILSALAALKGSSGSVCISCWLSGERTTSAHRSSPCPVPATTSFTARELHKGVAYHKFPRSASCHIHCWLPNYLHPNPRFNWGQQCEYSDIARDCVFSALSLPMYRSIFTHYAIDPSVMNPAEIAARLVVVREDDYRVDCTLIFTHIVIACALWRQDRM
jgi:superfamily II DNA or RNA helicase